MTLRRWIALIIGLIAAVGIVAAAYWVTQPREQIAALPTLAILPTATASVTPTDAPTNSPTPVVVIEIVTATLPPATSTPIPTATATATATVTLTPSLTPSQTITDTQSPPPTTPAPTVTATDVVQPISPQTYFVTVGSANLRSCPRRDCSMVAPLTRGEPIMVVGYAVGDTVSGSNIWFYAREFSYQGYVHSSLVALTMPVTATFTPAPVQIYVAPTSSGIGIVCADGTISNAQNRSGACSSHGGIAGDESGSSSAPTSAPLSSSSSGGFLCADGTTSHATHRQGACSYHGGIAPGH